MFVAKIVVSPIDGVSDVDAVHRNLIETQTSVLYGVYIYLYANNELQNDINGF